MLWIWRNLPTGLSFSIQPEVLAVFFSENGELAYWKEQRRLYMLSRTQKEAGKRPQRHISLHLSKAADLMAAFFVRMQFSILYLNKKKKGRYKYVNVLSPDNGRQC